MIKRLIKKWKMPIILLQLEMYFFSDWHVIKHLYKCLSVYYINIANSLILFSHKKSDQSLFSCPKNSFSSRQKYFNLMWFIHILVNSPFIYVYFSFVHQAVKKLNQKKKAKSCAIKYNFFSREILDSKF